MQDSGKLLCGRAKKEQLEWISPARTAGCGKIVLDFAPRLIPHDDMSDTSAILDANAAFYAAFLRGDIDALERLWANDDNISCIHPGWPAIVGRVAVIGSWRDILQSSGRPNITCHDPYVIVAGDDGRVLCIELVDSMPLAASNHFKRINGVWLMVHHQSSPIAQAANQGSGSGPTPSSQIH